MPPDAGIHKRMRKGTKSCLPCRRRKIRCSGVNDGSSCTECKSRGDDDKCVAQGIVLEDVPGVNRRLQQRVAELEARLADLGSGNSEGSPNRSQNHVRDGRTPQEALSNLLSGISNHVPGHRGTYPDDEEDVEEEELENTAAPLMRILTNPVLGVEEDGSGAARPSLPPLSNSSKSATPSKAAKDHSVIRKLCAYMPPEDEMTDILDNHSSWWPLYREAMSLHWSSEEEGGSLRSLAMQAFSEGHPSLLALLLVCFAISTGELQRYLPPVERRVLSDDDYAATEYGFNAMMATGLCYMGSLQPRRAWTIYRRANSLLQLHGLHQKRRSLKQEHVFWQLFHADRWVSLIIGLPYMMPDHFCDVTLPPKEETSTHVWLYRNFALITGRLVDTLHSVKGPSLAAAMAVDEELESIIPELPEGFLDLNHIRSCQDLMEKCTRLYRLIHWHLLRSLVHLPFFLREESQDRYEFSRKACINSSRAILEAYLEIIDTDAMMAYHGTILNFTAFAAAIIVLLGLIHYGRPKESEGPIPQWQIEKDWNSIRRILQALKTGASCRITRVMCRKCHGALETLIASVESTDEQGPTRVVLPYFGTISITRKQQHIRQGSGAGTWSDTLSSHSGQTGTGFAQPNTFQPNFAMQQGEQMFPNPAFDMAFTYQGPYLPEADATAWMLGDGFWSNQMYDDWSWLSTDLPPSSSI